jgi:hypothetical protein
MRLVIFRDLGALVIEADDVKVPVPGSGQPAASGSPPSSPACGVPEFGPRPELGIYAARSYSWTRPPRRARTIPHRIRARAPGRDLHGLDASVGQDRVKGFGELPVPVADQEPEARCTITEVHQEIADLLRGPRPVRAGGDPQDMDIAAADLHNEEAVQALERHREVDVEEIDGKHRRGLRVQELPPVRNCIPRQRWEDLEGLEDPLDRGRADPVTELEQFTLDPL